MEIKFTEVVQRAIVCMNERILNAPSVENRPFWCGFSTRWFNRIQVSRERVVGNDGTQEVVHRTVTFKHNNAVVASITLEGVYFLEEDGRRGSQFACWDIHQFRYARRYDPETGATNWTNFFDIPHNGATVMAKMR